jgi:type I restriction enzyme M protein
MLTAETKRKIDYLRDALVGKIPVPSQQIEQITLGLIYKFMSDIDEQNEELGGKSFFSGKYKKYSWKNIMDRSLAGQERVLFYSEGLEKMSRNKEIPQLFRDIFKGAVLPFKDPVVLDLFFKGINEFKYENSEQLGDAFEYLLSTAASQGDAGQFRTPRHIIDFIVEVVDPQKEDRILDPACGTAGFLVFAYKHILKNNTDKKSGKPGSLLTATERKKLTKNIVGYDISPEMVRLSLVNLYLHGFAEPNIYEYDTLSSLDRWDDNFDCLMANPPFMTPRGGIRPHNRFPIQANRSEVLFVDYITEHLTPNGKAGIIVPEGIIFQSGNAYKQLRKMLVEDGLWAVVSLPPGVFSPYAGVKTSILFFSNQIARRTKEILFIKVENDGFNLGARRRPIDKNDLPTRLEVLKKYKKTVQKGEKFNLSKEEEKFASVVKKEKIAEDGDYNLSASRYVEEIDNKNQKWPMMKIDDICDFIGKGERPASFATETGKIPFIVSSLTEKRCQAADYDMEALIIGDGGTANIHYIDGRFSSSDHTYILKNKDSKKVSLRYVYQLIANNLKVIERGFQGQGLKNVSKKHLKSIKIPLPPIEIQEKIILEFERFQKIIDGAKQIVSSYNPTIKIYPDWKHLKLEELSLFLTPPKKIQKNKYQVIGKYPIIDQSQKEIAGFTDDKTALVDVKQGVVIFGDHTCSIKYSETPFAQGADGIKILATKGNCLPKYLFYFLKANPIENEGYKRHFGKLKSILISLPPIETQKQIVSKIEEEQKAVEANRGLIKLFEQKIKDKISEVWGN